MLNSLVYTCDKPLESRTNIGANHGGWGIPINLKPTETEEDVEENKQGQRPALTNSDIYKIYDLSHTVIT